MTAPAPATLWAGLRYRHPFRKYQRLALGALDALPADARRFHVVAPPGSGKTVLGLEIVRRLGLPTLVLCPNTAIREQWREEFRDFRPATSNGQDGPNGPDDPIASTDANRLAPLTVLTYQSLCNLADPGDLLAAGAAALWRSEQMTARGLTADEAASEEARRRSRRPKAFARELASCQSRLKREIARGADGPRLLDLLHPNARDLVSRLVAGGYRALVLDECHHLFSLWGYVVRELARELGTETFVVGLTSTPPADLDGDELDLYRGLLGEPSFQVPTPAVVREGNLAPYQELAYFVEPLPAELEFVKSRHVLFGELITRVLGHGFASKSLTEWVIDRARFRESGPEVAAGDGGARLSYVQFARRHPTLARAAVRFLHSGGHRLPPEVHLNESLVQPPDIDDWIALLEDYCLRCLRDSDDEADARALEEVRRALIALGYVLTRTGVRAYVSPVDRVLALSAAKTVAATDILRRESDALGADLRALVVTDYEQVGAPLGEDLAAVLDSQAGSALRVLAALVADPFTASLRPVLVTGSGVYCGEWTAAELIEYIGAASSVVGSAEPVGASGLRTDSSLWTEVQEQEARPEGRVRSGLQPQSSAPGLQSRDCVPPKDRTPGGTPTRRLRLEPEPRVATLPNGERVVRVVGDVIWTTATYLPLVTAFFQSGGSRCIIGTRALLGEGWDAPRANVLVDLTTATTHTSMHQLRGRTLRIDPAWPAKVANNWDVVCVADLPKGASDYRRFVRKHRNYYGLTADGTIESGTTHVHPALSPFAPPSPSEIAGLNESLIRRSAARDAARLAWRVGDSYENAEIPTIRLRTTRPLGLAPRQSRLAAGAVGAERLGARSAAALGATWAAAAVALAVGAPVVAAVGVGAALSAGVGVGFLRGVGGAFRRMPDHLTLDGCARATLAALQELGDAPAALGSGAIQIVPRADGYYRCYLEGAPAETSRLFAECLADVLAPVENQRYLIPRYWAPRPTGPLDQTLFVARSLFGGLGRRSLFHVQHHPIPDHFATNRKRADVFARAWNRYVSPGDPIYTYGKAGGDLLAAERGRDPFGVLCQLRAIWQ